MTTKQLNEQQLLAAVAGLREKTIQIKEANATINVQGIQQAAKIKAYQDAIAAGKSEAEAQNAEAAAGNLAGAEALSKVDINNPATYINAPRPDNGPSSEAERLRWITPDAPATGQAAKPQAQPAAKQWQPGVLGVGSSGPEVSELQKKLGITADGKFGPATRQAVIALQQKLGVTPDGAYGPITKAAHDKMAGQGTQPSQPGYVNAKDVAPDVGTQTDAAYKLTQAQVDGKVAPGSLKDRVTFAQPEVPVPQGNPGGVGKNQTLTPAEKAEAEAALKDPNLGIKDKAYYAGQLGVPVPKQTTAPNVGATPTPAPAPAPTPAPTPANTGTPVPPRPSGAGQAREKRAWDRDYGKTHKLDGTLKENAGYNELGRIVSLVHYR